MRSNGSPSVLEYRRQLAVERVPAGYTAEEVADLLGVASRSVRRWVAQYAQGGLVALAARPAPGRPPKLTRAQEKIVLRWLADAPTDYGFANELWTAQRIAQLIEEEWGLTLHPRSVRRWLRQHHCSPQKPLIVPRERDPAALAAWLAADWPRIKKSPSPRRHLGFYR
jgi:transposase